MRDDEFDRLVNDELDGVATPEQKAELARRLAEGEAARARYHEIQTVFGMLDRIESIDPPPSLRGNVLRAVESRARTRSERGGWRGLILAGFGKRPGLGLGYAFAVGAVVGAVALAIGSGLFDRAGLRGPEMQGALLPPTGSRVDAIHLAAKGAQATGEMWTEFNGGVSVRLEVRSDVPFEAHVKFNPEIYIPVSLRRVEPSGGRFDLRRGELQVSDRGSARFELRLRAVTASRPPLSVWVGTSGGSAEGQLEPRPPNDPKIRR
ncbi:MAG TPA: hypothetical protein VFR25_00155 [Candidatus Eisenbacteria bacterium]|nr:hypothetical protein [Candidatus Eisenbacteria bacterium]